MIKHDYTKLDAAILAALRARPMVFHVLCGFSGVKNEAKALEAAHNAGLAHGSWCRKDAFRFIDSRLQALRKAGKIVHASQKTGWALVKQGGVA